jgi:hypothetical protein
LNNSHDLTLNDNVFYLKNNSPANLIEQFMNEYLNIENDRGKNQNQLLLNDTTSLLRTTQITWKNMQYLWKSFLDSKNLPSLMFLQTLKSILITKMPEYYNDSMDSFAGICSKYLPEIQKFLYFWDENMVIDDNEVEFEIGEIVILYRRWCINNGENISNLNDKQILDVIKYYYPTLEVERDKYISRIRCNLWDKQMDIEIAVDSMKELIRGKYPSSSLSPSLRHNVSIYDAYIYYCNFYSNNSNDKQIVSKSYFEKYIFENLSEYIVDSKFLTAEWYIL